MALKFIILSFPFLRLKMFTKRCVLISDNGKHSFLGCKIAKIVSRVKINKPKIQHCKLGKQVCTDCECVKNVNFLKACGKYGEKGHDKQLYII